MPLGIHRHIITVGGNWDPTDSITTRFHVDASDTNSYTLSGSTVTAVTDKSSNFSITVNGTPTRVTSGLNSLNVWDFSGSSEDFTTSDEQGRHGRFRQSLGHRRVPGGHHRRHAG